MIKVGIIGAGFIGRVHGEVYKKLDNVELIGVADIGKESGMKFAKDFQCQYYQDALLLIQQQEVDVIDICLPTYLHEQYVILAAMNDKHILCEKPFTLTLDSAQRMLDVVKKSGVKFMVAQVLRFWEEYVKTKQFYNHGLLGDIKVLYANRLGQRPNWNQWFDDTKKSGGGLFDLHLHDIDYARYLLGPVQSVYATGQKGPSGAWDHVITIMNFVSGAKAYVEGSSLMTQGYPFTMTLRAVGTKGTSEFRFAGGFNIENKEMAANQFLLYKNDQLPKMIATEGQDAYFNEIKYFIDCIEQNIDPKIVTQEDSKEVLEIMLGIKKSLETGEVIWFSH
ncbi:Gfo/Idh/MocA family oxidoreductase [Clostridiaceae bacterium 35-E11]